jgi:hypothetical protein
MTEQSSRGNHHTGVVDSRSDDGAGGSGHVGSRFLCAQNGENNAVTLGGAGSASGWIEVVNPTP